MGEGTTTAMTEITAALTTAMDSTSATALGAIAEVLPYCMSIMGAVLVIVIATKLFRRLSKSS